MRGIVFGVVVLLLPAIPAHAAEPKPAAPSQQALCAGGQDITHETQLAACNAIIEAATAPPEQLGEAYRQRCIMHNDRNESDAALPDCNHAVTLAPTAQAYMARARVYLDRGNGTRDAADFDRAIADETMALRVDPKLAVAYFFRASAFAAKGDYDHAIADYAKAIEINPNYRGIAGSQMDIVKAALARRAQGQGPGDQRAWCDGKALPEEGSAPDLQIKGCTSLINSGKESRDDLARDYINRASPRDYDDPDGAIEDYQSALDLYVGSAAIPAAITVAYQRMGVLYFLEGDYDGAVAILGKAVAANPQDTLSFSFRGDSRAAKGDFDRAIADYDAVLRLTPDAADTYIHRGRAYFGKRDFDHAIADAAQAIRLSRTSEATEGYNLRGDAHFRQGDFKTAIADYDQALKLWSDYAEALYGRGAAKQHNGDRAGAAADFAAARKLTPEIEVAEAKLGIAP
jgi:tetratricopeptide (TPR) repeat protein